VSLSLEFYTGDTSAIIAAVEAMDFDLLDDPAVVSARADLSLHLIPKDLDFLSIALGGAAGLPPIELRPHLDPVVDAPEYGLLAVDSAWVAYAATAPLTAAENVAESWVAQMQREYNDQTITVTDDVIDAVGQLITLCLTAECDGTPVVHVWYL
jgi:hypothetical protein